MAQYRQRNRIRSPYRPRHGDDPYRSQAGDLYRRLLDGYKQHRPAGGSPRHGGGSKYRSNVVRYHSGSGYKSKAKEGTRSQVIIRREPSPRVEFPEYRPDQPDVEVLLKELEKRFDEKLFERVLEIMEKEFDRTQAETFDRHDLSESTSDENLQERLEPLEKQEKASQQSEMSQDQPIETIPRTGAADEIVSEGRLMVEDESGSEDRVEDRDSPRDSGALEIVAENLPLENATESAAESNQAAEPIEATLLEDPLLKADIEALYDELDAEQLEPEEESTEPSY